LTLISEYSTGIFTPSPIEGEGEVFEAPDKVGGASIPCAGIPGLMSKVIILLKKYLLTCIIVKTEQTGAI